MKSDGGVRPQAPPLESSVSSPFERTACMLCGSTDLQVVLDLGEQFLQGAFVKPGYADPPRERFPLRLVRCASDVGCGLLQLEHSIPRQHLYTTYWYRSGVNRTMREHLASVATAAAETFGGVPRRVLDIGCNDGTLLTAFQRAGSSDLWGVEPSNAAADVPIGINVRRDFFPFAGSAERLDGTFDVVTSIAMFYDVDDPIGFAREVERALAPGGVWVVEVAYLSAMLANVGYDTICHEHLAYYSLETLEWVFREAGLELVRTELNDVNGASICCFVRRQAEVDRSDPGLASIGRLRAQEALGQLRDAATYERFAKRVETHRDDLRSLLCSLREQGRTIHVYGASTKGNTVLQYCGVDRAMIDCAADRNPHKVGARTLGSDIDIVSEEESRRRRPDYYLVLPWHFRDEIVERERATLAAGTAMIFPLPAVELVTA